MNMTLAQRINNMVELLHEPEQGLIYELVKRLVPDDVATPDDFAAHNKAVTEYYRDETISDSNIDWS